jgi:hypothetical protein
LGVDSERLEVVLCPEEEVEKDRFAIGGNLTDRIHAAVIPCLRQRYELQGCIFSLESKLVWNPNFEAAAEISFFNADQASNRDR